MPCDCGPGPSYVGEWRECEKKLCVARSTILSLVRHADGKVQWPKSLQNAIDREMNGLLEHKRAELNKDIDGIKRELNNLKSNRKRILELGGSDEPLNKEETTLRAKLEELQSITDEDLLA